MNGRINELLTEIKEREAELKKEITRIRIDTYEIRDQTVKFKDEVLAYHRANMMPLFQYMRHARIKHVLSAPVIALCLFPALLMDVVVSFYQAICFPIYGIPKVKRSEYIVIDRHYLKYLNAIEKLNCMFCGYFNGLISYVSEIASRTEQYWCPIKHASQLKNMHKRYHKFTEFGDSDQYREKAEAIRRDYGDLESKRDERSD